MHASMKVSTLLYADDMKMHNEINSCGDNEALQVDLINVYSWRCINKLSFNAGKCLATTLTKKNSL